MPLETQNIQLGPDGVNLVQEPWTIPDGQARWMQDIVLDKPDLIRRRGPVKVARNSEDDEFASISDYAVGIIATERPDEVWKVAVLAGDATTDDATLHAYSSDFTSTSLADISAAGVLHFENDKRYAVNTSPHPWGGVFVGWQNTNDARTQTGLFHWYGATKADYTTGTISVAQDVTTVFGVGTSWLANVEPGMFMYSRADADPSSSGDRTLIGVVKEVTSDTQLELTDGALFAVTGRGARFRSTRPISRRVAKGTITTTTNAKTVTGTNTKFRGHRLGTPTGTGHWAILRADDMKYIGIVNTVQSNIQCTLVSNATVVCDKEKYVAIDLYDARDLRISNAGEHGWITANFAGRTWYGNRPFSNVNQPQSPSRIWFSDVFDPEAVDLTADGDHLLVPSTEQPLKPITAMYGTASALLVFKEDETWGVFGTDETNFTLRRLNGDGVFTPMCIQPWKDGVVYAGQRGVWYFDGQEVFNLTEDRLGEWYEKAVQKFPTKTYKAWSMMYNNNYFLYIDVADPPFGPDKTENDDNGLGTPQHMISMCINMERRAITFFTNFAFHGSVRSPYEDTLGVLYVTNEVNAAGVHQGGRVGQARDLFDSVGVDEFYTDVIHADDRVLGPDFFYESRRYDFNEGQLKKRFKQLQLNYRLDSTDGDYISLGATGDGLTDYTTNYLKFATLVGLNNIATESRGKWPITRARDNDKVWRAAFQNRRLKFNKRSQHLGFKIWQASTGIERLEIGPAAIGFKLMRKGRV